ncbi:MAG: ankyrin repeat domain-containing protein [Planctomycetota bacterium]
MTRERKLAITALVAVGILTIPMSLIFRRHRSILRHLSPFSRLTGMTDLHWAAWDGRTGAVKKLLAKGADVNCRDKDGATPLHIAAFHSNKKTVQLLISKGADINAKEDDGSTPLHDAAFGGRIEIVKLLIASDADINARLTNGRTPLDCANTVHDPFPFSIFLKIFMGVDNEACAEILREHGARGYYRKTSGSTDRGHILPFCGLGVGFIAYIWFLVIAFREDILWGFYCLLLPIVTPVFLIEYWDKCKKPFYLSLIGGAIIFIGMFLQPALSLINW